MFKFYIDNAEVLEQPKEWDSLTSTVRLDKELKGLFTVLDVTQTFFKDGYVIIKDAFDQFGYCHSMTFEVRQYNETLTGYLPIYTGLLFLKDVEFAEGIEGLSAKCSIQDNSFFAKIRNNRNLKAKIYVGKSKNNVSITAAPYYTLEYFYPATGAYTPVFSGVGNERNNTAFKVFDVMKFFVEFMSDGTMDFYSDTFGVGGKYENYLITNGYTTRLSGPGGGGETQELFEDNWAEMDFSTVFKELDKEFNIGFVAGFDGSRAYMRIEEWNYLFPQNVIEDLPDVDVIKRRSAIEYLYDKILVGSEIITHEPTFLSGPDDIRFVWFKKEEYIITGTCNTDRSLDLVNSWIIDSNTIEDLFTNGMTSAPDTYDQNIILVQATFDAGINYKADQSNWITGAATPVFYNETLNTNNKTNRYLGAVPNSIAIQLGVVDNKFTASCPSEYDATNNGSSAIAQDLFPLDVSNEISDPSSNYDPATYTYTAPTGGVYVFNWNGFFKLFDNFPGSGSPSCEMTVIVYLENISTGQQLEIYNVNSNYACGSVVNVNTTGTMNLSATDKVQLHLNFVGMFNGALHVGTNVRLLRGSQWRCVATADGGGVYKEFDPTDYPVIRSSLLKYPFEQARFRAYISNPRGLVSYNIKDGKKYYGATEELKYNHYKEESDWTILSTEKINQ